MPTDKKISPPQPEKQPTDKKADESKPATTNVGTTG